MLEHLRAQQVVGAAVAQRRVQAVEVQVRVFAAAVLGGLQHFHADVFGLREAVPVGPRAAAHVDEQAAHAFAGARDLAAQRPRAEEKGIKQSASARHHGTRCQIEPT